MDGYNLFHRKIYIYRWIGVTCLKAVHIINMEQQPPIPVLSTEMLLKNEHFDLFQTLFKYSSVVMEFLTGS